MECWGPAEWASSVSSFIYITTPKDGMTLMVRFDDYCRCEKGVRVGDELGDT
jgi:hypothetical protein